MTLTRAPGKASDVGDEGRRRTSAGAGEERDERVEIDGLHEMVVEPRLAGTAAVFVLAISRDGDDDGGRAARFFPEDLRDLVAVHPREADVEEHEFRLQEACRLDRGRPVVGDPGVVAEELEQL